ncbi:MAG TPA: hemolysin family protein [Pirellulaceae bacterium]|jgi:CBS domain containing-hemolysin-like protein|nr:hemolysin family protein [Pirellulaceae bacterium]
MVLFAAVLIVALIAVNALYVAAEFSAVSVRHSRIHALADEGSSLARRLLRRIGDPAAQDRYVACCQVGITLSSLLLGAVGQATLTVPLATLLSDWTAIQPTAALSTSAVAVLLVLTAAQMVLGELVPKSLALQYPTQTALFTVLPLTWSLRVLAPFILVLNGSGTLLLRMVGVHGAGHRHIHSPDEIELLIVDSRDGGLLEPEEQRRLHQALRLSRRPAHQLMVPRPKMMTIDAKTSPEATLRRVAESPFSRLPVVRGAKDDVVGVLYTKDVIARYIDHGRLPPIPQMMRPLLTVPRNVTADRLLTLFREHRCQQAALIDEYGGVEGLVTLEDILAEVFGDFRDEFKQLDPEPTILPDGRIRASGPTRLDDLEPLLGTRLEGGDASTVGGLALYTLGRLPSAGEKIAVDGFELEVESLDDRTVAWALLRKLPPSEVATEDLEGERS